LPAEDGQPDNIATAITEVSENLTKLVQDEIELAKAEMVEKATSLGRGVVAIAAGAVFGIFAVVFILETVAWGLNAVFVTGVGDIWFGFAVVMVLLIIFTIVAFVLARKLFNVGAPTPNMAIDEAKKIRDTVSSAGKQN
jgi:Putative Actinobacterial Holin-X, holin superfamily III